MVINLSECIVGGVDPVASRSMVRVVGEIRIYSFEDQVRGRRRDVL